MASHEEGFVTSLSLLCSFQIILCLGFCCLRISYLFISVHVKNFSHLKACSEFLNKFTVALAQCVDLVKNIELATTFVRICNNEGYRG